MTKIRTEAGYMLADLMVGLLVTAFVAQATMTVLANFTSAHQQQEVMVDTEQNLRVAMGMLTDSLRYSGYGIPETSVATWIPWVSGFNANPKITFGSPATLSLASCTSSPVAHLTASAAQGSTTLAASSDVLGKSVSQVLDTGNKRLLLIGDSEYAHVTLLSGNTLTIDADPATTGNQGLSRQFPSGTSICRVDVTTLTVDVGASQLTLNQNQGAGAVVVAEGISGLQINTVEAGKRYEITLTASDVDPATGASFSRTLRSDVTVRNAS